jgi:hypothetical protein
VLRNEKIEPACLPGCLRALQAPCADVRTLIREYMEDFPAAVVAELQQQTVAAEARL